MRSCQYRIIRYLFTFTATFHPWLSLRGATALDLGWLFPRVSGLHVFRHGLIDLVFDHRRVFCGVIMLFRHFSLRLFGSNRLWFRFQAIQLYDIRQHAFYQLDLSFHFLEITNYLRWR